MSSTPREKPWLLNTGLGILFLLLGAYGVWIALHDAARHIIRHGGYRTGYASVYPWQGILFSIGLVFIGGLLLYPTIRWFALGDHHAGGSTQNAAPRADRAK